MVQKEIAAVIPGVREPVHWFDPGLKLPVEELILVSVIDEVYPELRLVDKINSFFFRTNTECLIFSSKWLFLQYKLSVSNKMKPTQPEIKKLEVRKLVGKSIKTSFANNQTSELWRNFMPGKDAIENTVSNDLYAVEIYDSTQFFKHYDPNKEFEKWAAIEVNNFDSVPENMETLVIPEGLYAVFAYKGKGSEATKTYQYILGTWIPNSEYELDDRPHFALMGKKYKNEDPDSEEELWFPVKIIDKL